MFTPKILVKRRFDFSEIHIHHVDHPQWFLDDDIHEAVNDARKTLYEKHKKEWKETRDGRFYRIDNLDWLLQSPMRFEFGIINYRYLTWDAVRKFFDYYKQDPNRYPCHLSTKAMIETSDWFFVLGGRKGSKDVDLIGWWASPDELEINTWSDIRKNLEKEMYEEAGICEHHISSLEGVWVVFSYTSNIIVIAHAVLHISRAELDEVFLWRSDDEMDRLIYLQREELAEYMGALSSYRPLVPSLL